MLVPKFSKSATAKYRTLFRFHNQHLDWTFRDLDHYSDSFLGGLQENKIAPNTTILTWFDEKHGAEALSTLIGGLKNENKVLPISSFEKSKNVTPEILRKLVLEINPSVILLSPNQKIENVSKHDLMSKAIPESLSFGETGYLNVPSIPNLRFLIQTGFYKKPGFVKYRDFCVYSPPTMRILNKPDSPKALEELSAKVKNWPAVTEKDHVYLLGGLEKLDWVAKGLLETGNIGSFIDFVPEEVIQKNDFVFFNEIEDDVRCHFIGNETNLQLMKHGLKRKNNNFVDFG